MMYKYKLSYNNKEFKMLDYYGSIKWKKDEIDDIINNILIISR